MTGRLEILYSKRIIKIILKTKVSKAKKYNLRKKRLSVLRYITIYG